MRSFDPTLNVSVSVPQSFAASALKQAVAALPVRGKPVPSQAEPDHRPNCHVEVTYDASSPPAQRRSAFRRWQSTLGSS
jgi:hypothetical protein